MAALADDWRGRISVDPEICHGKPCIRGTRVLVELIVAYIANGDSIEDVLASYPTITKADVYAALQYGSGSLGM